MIWDAAAAISVAYDSLNLLSTGVVGAQIPAHFVESQIEEIHMAERLHAQEVRVESVARGVTVDALITELTTARWAILDLEDLADYQEELAWDLYEQGIILRWDHALRAIPPHRRPAAAQHTGIPDEEFAPISSGIFAEKPAHGPRGLRDLTE
jgi:hypothetical protein